MPPSSQAYSLPEAHALPATAVAARLAVDPPTGLESTEAARRAARIGPNQLEPPKRTSVWRLVVEAATEPFVLLLLAAGAGAVLLGEVRDGLLVLVGLIPIVGADVITEYRGERALEALRDASAPLSRVRRNGTVSQVIAASLVPGDVVLLSGGDVVPADLRLIRVDRLQLDRSVLTGESIPEPGRTEPDAGDSDLADRRSIAYGGTSVVGGRGEGIVVATGATTELGRISGGLTDRGRRRSPLQAELDRLVRILLWVAIGLITIVMSLGFIRGQDAGATILAGISAAIAAIPEEPPILLAVVLGLGAYRLLKRGVLVRRLNAEESLGAVDLIITDKTGTLTRNRLDVASVRTPAGPVEDADDRSAILLDALRAEEDAWAIGGGSPPSSFTRSLMRAVEEDGWAARLDPAELLDAEPVSDSRPFARTRARRDGRVETLLIGAPEAVLAESGGSRTTQTAWEVLIEGSAATGERTVGLARREGDGPTEMRALIGFADPLRDGIREALATARMAGIQTIVVTGDHPATAAAIAHQAGLERPNVVVGRTLESWDDAELAAELGNLQVVARSTPEGKERLVRVAREHGRTVAVTGDGVNDAPALNHADVGVAMGSGTAVAREAADLVLGDDSFATLLFGLREGRRIVDNVQKGLIFLDLDPRRAARVHPHRDDLRLRPTAAAAPDPVARAVHRPVDVGRVRARARGAGDHGPPAARPADPPPEQRDPCPDRRRRRVQCRCRARDHGHPPRHARARAMAGLHDPGLRPARAGLREPKPDGPAPPSRAEHLPAAHRPRRARDPGGDPVCAAIRRGVPRDAARAGRLGRRRCRGARAGRAGRGRAHGPRAPVDRLSADPAELAAERPERVPGLS